MSLASDISAPAALSPLLATGAQAAAPAAPAPGFSQALTEAQAVDAGGVVAPELAAAGVQVVDTAAAPVALPLDATADLPQAAGSGAVVAYRQTFVPVHGLPEFPVAANLDSRPALVPAAILAAPEADAPQTEAEAVPPQALVVTGPIAKPVAAKPAKPAAAQPDETDEPADETLPAAVAAPAAQPAVAANPAEPAAKPAEDRASAATSAPQTAITTAQPETTSLETLPTDTAADPLPTSDLRQALSGLSLLEPAPTASPQPDPVAAPMAEPAAPAAETTQPDLPDADLAAPDLVTAEMTATLSQTATAAASDAFPAQQAQTLTPVITVQVAPALTPSAPVLPTLRMDQADWPEKLAVRLAGAFNAEDAQIEMQLSPERLGPLHIRLEMKSGMAQVFVTAATPQAAEAFARAEPQLHALLAASEVSLSGQQTASGGFSQQGGSAPDAQGGQRGSHGQPHRFAQPEPSRSAAPEASASRLLNLIA
jgi:flagellar hook-length control protein FliK